MNNTLKYFFYFISLIIFLLPCYINFTLTDLNTPAMFEDEICSYNGSKEKSLSNDTFINCTCQAEFTHDFSTNRYINGVPVQCSYEKKRRFIALFLSIFLPFGVDHLYLGKYLAFTLIFLSCGLTLFGNCFRFAVSPHTNYFKNKSNLIFIILAILMLIWWMLNIALIWTGIITDGNGKETVDDLNFLININS